MRNKIDIGDITTPRERAMDDIDLVYLWVDGNDPRWLAKRNAFLDNTGKISEVNCKGRSANNDELKYSLRSVEKYTPWIHRIFIVTDEQTPDWIDVSNKKVKIVDIREIMPDVCLPCFNSSVIEYFLYKIPELSEHFLFANDDMFFCADVGPDFFFAEDGNPIVRLKRMPFGKLHYWAKLMRKKGAGTYATTVHKAAVLIEKMFGKYYSGVPHHNIDAYRKDDFCEAIEDKFSEQVFKTMTNRFRNPDDLQRIAILYYVLAIGHGHLKYVTNRESMRIPAHRNDPMKHLLRQRPQLFCLNDCQRTTDEDRARIKPFLETLFPDKSTFEK